MTKLERHNRRKLNEMIGRISKKGKPAKVWKFCVIYPTARLGKNVNIGAHSEIGAGVEIGDGTRIGAGCFIPEGCTIGKNVFIGPRVTMMNDIQPPSPKSQWLKTVIKDNAVIGAACSILPGVTVGEGTMLGAASILTKSTGKHELWYGHPAKKMGLL